ncbi:PEP-CTERM sorting domain-containing protein [Marinobacter sp. JSM 1782161]|uniref:PEP-CTERM sorting domain-containing protein n=1 Tax=Marinobacter sp. JSM 1782161 TaxID=2685906 RepID=UPI0014033D4C|nr:PEP-CTERM sorting domain-containing protein [Marinobacter sp. JSM 1782161]
MGKKKAFVLTASLLCASPVFAAPVLDQSFVPQDGPQYLSSFGYDPDSGVTTEHFQSFTAGQTGTLSNIDLLFSSFGQPGGDLTLSIYEGGHMNGDFLGSTTVSGGYTSPNDFVRFDLSASSIFVESGKRLGFVIGTTQDLAFPDTYLLQGDASSGSYDGGFGGSLRNGALTLDYEKDFYFRSYVDVATVPEPGSITLAGLGLIGLAISRRGRAKA